MPQIPLGPRGEHLAEVDQCDYAWLCQWRWHFKISAWKFGALVYARRNSRTAKPGQQFTVLMHVAILEERMGIPRPSELHTVDHLDGDTLNNRRDNLEWATASEQIQNQCRRRTKGAPAVEHPVPY